VGLAAALALGARRAAAQLAQNVELVGQIGGVTSAVAVQGRYAYIGVRLRLVILNVADPAHPAVVGWMGVLPDVVGDVVVSGTYAYVAAGDGGLRIIKVSNPAALTEVGSYNTPGWTHGVVVSGTYAYVADRGAGLRIINVFNPAAPAEAGFYDTPGYAYGSDGLRTAAQPGGQGRLLEQVW